MRAFSVYDEHMKFLFFILLLILAVLASLYSGKEYIINSEVVTVAEYCGYTRELLGCDADYCETKCVRRGTLGGCVDGCVPKKCQAYDVEQCPSQYCRVKSNFYGERVCVDLEE